ncbi:hypothetical protein ACTXGK_12640 [Psychrobacter sp. T6-5]|uniref:hypothetical protein n=1 Tax=Psychrobacter sp. T6-5 TaxID=3457451 RepID=UPI003FD1A442
MRDLHFKTKTHQAWAGIVSTVDRGNFVFVHIRSSKTGKELNNYKLPADLAEQVEKIKSYSALVAYAKANQITDSASDAHRGSDSSSVPSCPAPALTPAKSSEQERGILFVEVDTVGRGKDTEIIEISVVDNTENVLFHSRVRPSKPYKDVPMGEPSFAEIWQGLSNAIGRADIAFYNADFTKRYILQSIAKAFDTPKPEHFYTLFPYNKVICVGERYKEFNNYRLGYFCNYGLQHINSACGQSGLFWKDVSNSPSGNAIKSARLWKYLDHKAVA